MLISNNDQTRRPRRRRCALEQLEPRSLLNAHSLIGLDLLRADPRFAGIDGRGYSAVVLDYGADLDHAAFGPDADGNGIADRIVYQQDFGNGDNDASEGSFGSHGTHVTSIIGSQDTSFPGVAPGANLIVLKVFENDSSSGGNPGVDISALEQALQWVSHHVLFYNIITLNLSIADGNHIAPFLSSRVNDEFQRLADAGVISVAAGGNLYHRFGSVAGVAYPAADPFVLAVGSVWDDTYGARTVEDALDRTTGADRVSGYSQRHPTMTDILAPGGVITGARDGGGFISKQGSSMAAPFVTGAVLLAQQLAQREIGRFLTFDEFRTLIRDTAVTVNDGDDENYNVTATGADFFRLNVFAMAESLLNNPGPPSISVTDATVDEGDSGTSIAEITVQLTRATTSPVTVQYSTANGTATLAGGDYAAGSGTVTIDPGQTSRKLQFVINGDKDVEPNEAFFVNFSNPSGGVLADTQSLVTIANDDFIRLWQNPRGAMDVNDNGSVTGLDALIIINRLNTVGSGVLPSQPPAGRYFFYDVNGDNACTPLDALIVINELNRRSQQGGGPMAAASPDESAGDEAVGKPSETTNSTAGPRAATRKGPGAIGIGFLGSEAKPARATGAAAPAHKELAIAGIIDATDSLGSEPLVTGWAGSMTDRLATGRARARSAFWGEYR